jgi:glycerophosphoryl diester phosphodiesterase
VATAPEWLTARPIAHRGLHDAAGGLIENTAGAVRAAIDGAYGIEVDLQLSADGEAMVHHDDVLGRLTDGAGRGLSIKLTDIAFEALTESGRARPSPYLARAKWVRFDDLATLDPDEVADWLQTAHGLVAAKLIGWTRPVAGPQLQV